MKKENSFQPEVIVDIPPNKNGKCYKINKKSNARQYLMAIIKEKSRYY